MLVSGLRIQTTNQEQYAELQTERLLHVLKDRLLQVSEVSAFFFFFFNPFFLPLHLQSYEIKEVHLYSKINFSSD